MIIHDSKDGFQRQIHSIDNTPFLARRIIKEVEGVLETIGLDKNKVCTYCWTGKE